MDVSVIIPLVECRGRALDSIESWARGQTLERKRYEVVVVGGGHDPAFRRRIEERLTPDDSIVPSRERGAAALYNVGARHARAPLLFITESHCVGHPSCLERLLEFIAASGAHGAFCASDGLPGNLFSRMEQRLFEEELRKRRAASSSVISVRGTAIDRARFLAAGGFDGRYGHFSELLLGDALEAQGTRMGFAESAVVSHENIGRASELIEALREYGREECRFAADAHASWRRCDVWEQRANWSKPIARARLAALVRRGLPLIESSRDAADFVTAAGGLLAPAAAGITGRLWASRALLWWLRVRLALARVRPDAYFEIYARLWHCAIRHGAYELVAERASPSAVPEMPFDMGRPDERLVGFHGVERSEDGTFRWSEPTALVRLALEPGDYTLTLRLAPRAGRSDDTLAAFFDGRRVRHVVESANPPRVVFEIPREVIRPRPAHELVWVCRRRPVDRRIDARALGLPVAGIEIASVRPQRPPSSSSR